MSWTASPGSWTTNGDENELTFDHVTSEDTMARLYMGRSLGLDRVTDARGYTWQWTPKEDAMTDDNRDTDTADLDPDEADLPDNVPDGDVAEGEVDE